MKQTAHRPFEVARDGAVLRGTVEGHGPELLFLHGLNASAAMQRPNAPGGFMMAAYDQRGHGASTRRTDAAAYRIGEFSADAVAVLDELGWERAIIAGTSMGAAVAMRLALDHPERVRALALQAPAFGEEASTEIARFDAIADAIERLGIERAIPEFQRGMQSRGLPAEATAWLDGWSAHDAGVLAAAERVVGRWTVPDLASLSVLACPVVVVAWPDDAMHPAALARRIAGLTGGRIAWVRSLAEALMRPEVLSEATRGLLLDALG